MTTPQGPSRGDPSEWARPTAPRPQPTSPPSQSPTQRIPHPGRPQEPRRQPGPPPRQPGPPPVQRPQHPGPPPAAPPPHVGRSPSPQPQPPGPPQPAEQATTRLSTHPPSKDTPVKTQRGFFRNPTAVVLVLVTVVALVLAGLIGAELYTRHTADAKVTNAVQCEVQDSASVSFAVTPPVLWQYITGHYTNISVQTAGNQVRSAKGMKISLDIHDVRLANSGNSKGTIGALNGTITWSSEGIKESIQDAIPVLGSLVTSKVTTNPTDGTVQLKGLLDSATVKPQIANNGLSLQLVELRALGSKLSTNTVQRNLDDLTAKATQNYPLGIHADSVKVTDSGVEATFSSQNATIPASSSQPQTGQDCFGNL
ncbi:DUF2993 domain-containing protein [Mycobacterium xenopi]|uniref:LmeA family phospholipid-binding protein n=1 Tax=Mycobacterium xenopi TaxID=1789 RepID=UPI000680D29E|nr:DUF2993 domain-containing protein [Mycobacterium xenopi]MDA3640046.1 DUF2993 domain-containing protein [Mycobacterium xenopi]MDA3658725.1 DUF2993 domain-containing protein [Mycobacterium xenopi]MDA3660793.1 DUF2993 domain-containing protein [Mycobacterium xenopi]ORX16157.1 hypothetical protein AWC32_13075 [Mycobacterium xenopi]